MQRDPQHLRWYHFFPVTIYYMGLTAISQTLVPLVLPLLIQQFVGEARQGTYLGRMRLWALMVAILAQAFWGMMSDRTRHRLGRRRPFVLGGTLADLVFIVAIGFSAQMPGMPGFNFLFVMYLLLQVASNAAQGAVQGLIPDLVSEERRGLASAIKALFEVPLPVILVAFTIAPLITAGNLWGGLFVLMGLLLLVMAVTMFAPEQPLAVAPPPMDWQPLLRLGAMTAVFTVIILILGEGVQQVSHALVGMGASTLLLVMGILGLLTMSLAVVAGVWISIHICVGTERARAAPSFTWWVISRLAYLVGSTNLAGFVLYFLQGRLGFTRERAAAPASQMMLFVGVFILLSALPGGWLTDRLGRKRMLMSSGVVAAGGVVVILLATNLTLVYVAGAIIGVATGIFYAASWALGTSLVPQEEAGRYLGIANLAGAGAGAVGAYIGGPVADFFTTYVPETPGLGYVLIFGIYGVLFLLSVVTLLKVHEPDVSVPVE